MSSDTLTLRQRDAVALMRLIGKAVVMAWASPNSAIGLIFGLIALATGGRGQWREGCLEFYGGLLGRLYRPLPHGIGASAITLGHVILGASAAVLRSAGDHERVHVRQYERWGPAFLPAYLACSLWLWLRGRDPYWDNPFEREAYEQCP